MNQSHYFKTVIAVISVFIAVVLGWSLGSNLMSPFYTTNREKRFLQVPGFKTLVEEHPTLLSFQLMEQDEFLKENTIQQVWVVKHSSQKATVFSPFCPHLGCRYKWDPALKEFDCPCHASFFNLKGQVLSGPAPRPLDTLSYMIKDDQLYIQWEQFKPGVSQKIEL